MPNNFYCAANLYLNEWMWKDSRFHRILAFERRDETSAEKGRECLVEVAEDYKVIRTLRRTGESLRLQAAYEALEATEIPNEGDVVRKVESFADVLRGHYGVFALSAASKFLWMRFRSPVIIYDSFVSAWLRKNYGYKGDGYSNYYRIWSSKYQEYEDQIRCACTELKEVKRFTRAYGVSDEKLSELATSRWFMERVFDHFMLYALGPT